MYANTWSNTTGVYTFGDLTVDTNATLYLELYDSGDTNYTNDYGVTLNTTNTTIEGVVDTNTQGYPATYGPGVGTNGTTSGGGGGYGGAGGDGDDSSGGIIYGSSTSPTDLGSGGGTATGGGAGGTAGGAVKLTATSNITHNGTITANGGNGSVASSEGGGGGSGGSIWLAITGTFSGSGSITANGGNGGDSTADGGAGGGGRISIDVTTNSYTGSKSVIGGSSPTGNEGSSGTVSINSSVVNIPSNLVQYESNGITPISTGSNINETTVVTKLNVVDPGSTTTITPEIELRPVGTSFSDVSNYIGIPVSYVGSEVTLSTTVSDNWYSSSWTKRKPVKIANTTTSLLTNHPVRVVVTYDSDMQTDFDDIRFANSSGTLLNY
jgi:hypothetical protein